VSALIGRPLRQQGSGASHSDWREQCGSIPSPLLSHLHGGSTLTRIRQGKKGQIRPNDPVPCLFYVSRVTTGCAGFRCSTRISCSHAHRAFQRNVSVGDLAAGEIEHGLSSPAFKRLSKWKGRPDEEPPHCKVRISSNSAKQVATIAAHISISLSTIGHSRSFCRCCPMNA
jgi:hypothetical protein